MFKPSIKLAEEGFPLSRALAKSLRSKEVIKNNTGLRDIFVNPLTNDFYKENDTIKMPKLARTLKNISESGYELFYKGALTPIIVSEINRSGKLYLLNVFCFRVCMAILKVYVTNRRKCIFGGFQTL